MFIYNTEFLRNYLLINGQLGMDLYAAYRFIYFTQLKSLMLQ